MSDPVVIERLAAYLLERFPLARARGLSPRAPLLENGILDSLGILDLVTYLESEFGIRVADDDLVPEHFQTLEHITAFVCARRGEAAAG